MKLLALDTSSVACSVALEIDGEIMERHEEQAREHTRLLMPMLRDVFAEAALTPAELDAVVLGNGPGSFIGMRIAASVAQGLAFGSGLRIGEVVVAQDAHMNEVYLGLFGRGDAGLPYALAPERLHDQGEIGELRDEPGRFVAAGFGWQRYPALMDANRDCLAGTSSALYPAARYLLPEGRRLHDTGGAIEPQDVVPAYLRQTVARARANADP